MKSDYLKDCMSEVGNIPLDQFNLIFCRRCGNQECTRSRLNNSFQTRVQTWEDRLFKSPPRADDDDPRFSNIRAKKFLPVGRQSYEIHTTQNIPIIPLKEETSKPPAPIQPPAPTPVQPPPVQPPPTQSQPKPQPKPPPTPVAPPPVSPPNIGNTEFNQGTMIGGQTEKILEPGGTFTFGDDE
jgi:hypothetical protein